MNVVTTTVLERTGTTAASQMNAGKSTDVKRPTDSRPPTASGGRMLIRMKTAYGKPRRRATGHDATTTKSAASAGSTPPGLFAVYAYTPDVESCWYQSVITVNPWY